MSFLERLDEDLKKALKESDKLKLSVLRMAKSAIKYQQIDKGRPLTDEEVSSALSTMAKQRRESIEQFSKGGRTDLAEQEKQELTILQSYMPKQLSNEEVDNIIKQAINESEAKNEADMGKVMKLLMPRVKGVADGKWVNNRVRELLQSTNN